jgi:hypothetical protein
MSDINRRDLFAGAGGLMAAAFTRGFALAAPGIPPASPGARRC